MRRTEQGPVQRPASEDVIFISRGDTVCGCLWIDERVFIGFFDERDFILLSAIFPWVSHPPTDRLSFDRSVHVGTQVGCDYFHERTDGGRNKTRHHGKRRTLELWLSSARMI